MHMNYGTWRLTMCKLAAFCYKWFLLSFATVIPECQHLLTFIMFNGILNTELGIDSSNSLSWNASSMEKVFASRNLCCPFLNNLYQITFTMYNFIWFTRICDYLVFLSFSIRGKALVLSAGCSFFSIILTLSSSYHHFPCLLNSLGQTDFFLEG